MYGGVWRSDERVTEKPLCELPEKTANLTEFCSPYVLQLWMTFSFFFWPCGLGGFPLLMSVI